VQLGIHDKPCGLLNVEGYYDSLIKFLGHVLAEQFVKRHHHAMLIVEETPDPLLERFFNFQPPDVKPWILKNET
jgi:hypothetical protein